MEYPEEGRSHLAYLAVSSIYFPSFLTVLVLTFNLLNRDNINFKIDFKHLRKKTRGKKPFHPHRSFRSFHFAKCCAQLQWILLATILDRIDTIASRKTVQHSICQTIGRGITGKTEESTIVNNRRNQRNRAGDWRGILMEGRERRLGHPVTGRFSRTTAALPARG